MAALTLLAASAAQAAPPASAALPAQVSSPASLTPSDSVHCVYDLMSTEDREMALLLFEREVASTAKSHSGSRNLKVIDRLIEEARTKCARPYAWSGGRADAAIAYATNELMSEGVAQALAAKGHTTGPIDAYFAAHYPQLAGLTEIEGARADDFREYLFGQGWTKDETASLGVAEFYLESLLARDRETTAFGAAALHPAAHRKPLAKRPSRAGTAARGKP